MGVKNYILLPRVKRRNAICITLGLTMDYAQAGLTKKQVHHIMVDLWRDSRVPRKSFNDFKKEVEDMYGIRVHNAWITSSNPDQFTFSVIDEMKYTMFLLKYK